MFFVFFSDKSIKSIFHTTSITITPLPPPHIYISCLLCVFVFPGCGSIPREWGPAAKTEGGCRGATCGHQCCCSERHQEEADQQTGGQSRQKNSSFCTADYDIATLIVSCIKQHQVLVLDASGDLQSLSWVVTDTMSKSKSVWPHVRVYLDLRIPQNAAKQAAAAATQTIAAAQNAAASNKNTAAHQQLVQSCKVRQ